jgi:uncharacterized protein (DUF2141 family)
MDYPMISRLLRSLAALPLVTGTFLVGTTLAQAQAAPADCQGQPSSTWLRVAVGGVRSGSGLVTLALYGDDSGRFLAHHGSLFNARVPAHAGTTVACLFVPRPGVYAIAVYHDENGNRKLDRTGFGLPAEGFGFSNNPSTIAGLPTFSSVRLQIPHANVATRISLRYL